MADVAINLYGMTAVISRATRSINRGSPSASHEVHSSCTFMSDGQNSDRLTDWLTDLRTYHVWSGLSKFQTIWPKNCRVIVLLLSDGPEWLNYCWNDWLTGWLNDWLTSLLSSWLINWQTARRTDWLTDSLSDWQTDSLTDWQTDPLTDWIQIPDSSTASMSVH